MEKPSQYIVDLSGKGDLNTRAFHAESMKPSTINLRGAQSNKNVLDLRNTLTDKEKADLKTSLSSIDSGRTINLKDPSSFKKSHTAMDVVRGDKSNNIVDLKNIAPTEKVEEKNNTETSVESKEVETSKKGLMRTIAELAFNTMFLGAHYTGARSAYNYAVDDRLPLMYAYSSDKTMGFMDYLKNKKESMKKTKESLGKRTMWLNNLLSQKVAEIKGTQKSAPIKK